MRTKYTNSMIQTAAPNQIAPTDYWQREVIADIRTKSQIGRYRVRGYGAFKTLPTFDDLTFVFPPSDSRNWPTSAAKSICTRRWADGTRKCRSRTTFRFRFPR